MSVSASIDIKLAENDQRIISPFEIIENLLHNGWTLNDNSQMSYLPLGDDGDYNWQTESINKESLINVIKEKEK